MTLPQGTTGPDVLTTIAAYVALGISLFNLLLNYRRDRDERRVAVALSISGSPEEVILRLANAGRRPATIERAGFAIERRTPAEFAGFDRINARRHPTLPMMVSDPPLPVRLDPGDPAYTVRAPLHKVKRDYLREPPAWAWAEDTNGRRLWVAMPSDVRSRIRATKRRMSVRTDSGDVEEVEIDDSQSLEDQI